MPLRRFNQQTRALTEVNNDPLDIPEHMVLGLSGLALRGPIKKFRVDFSGFRDLIKNCYLKYCNSCIYFNRSVTPAMFEYYCTIALWVRIYMIKRYNHEQLCNEVSVLFQLNLVLPKPIYTYLSGLGELTDPRGVKYELDVPVPSDTPHWLQFAGAFGQVGPETIPHYVANASTFPVMYRMYCEAAPVEWIENHLNYDLPGNFQIENLHPNRNMFGYDHLHHPTPDAKRELIRCGITSYASDPHQPFIVPNDNPVPCYGGVLVNTEVIDFVKAKLCSVKELVAIPDVPKNRTGSLSQTGFIQCSSSDDLIQQIRPNFCLTEGQVRGCAAHQLTVKAANAIVCMKYRVERSSSISEPQPQMFPYSGDIPQSWHDTVSLYFNYGGVKIWNFVDFTLPSVSGILASSKFVDNLY